MVRATAKAYPNAGKISKIEVTNPGMGYLKAPDVVLNGSVEEGGVAGEARAVLGNGKAHEVQKLYSFPTE